MKNIKFTFALIVACYSVSVQGMDPNLSKSSDRLGEMVTIPAGDFLMGSNSNDGFGGPEESPQHRVYLPTYQIGKYEVTRGQYRKFIEAGGYDDPKYWSAEGWEWKESDDIVYAGMNGTFSKVIRQNKEEKRKEPEHWKAEQEWIGHGYEHPVFIQTDQHPVVGVTYYEAEAYCKWAGGRLPTEAEWEKAASWDEGKQHANTWPWGDTLEPEYCNNPEDHNPTGGGYKVNQSAPVGSYPKGASPYGCMDMVGNAYEWVADTAKSYPGNPEPFEHKGFHFVRGGCWDDGLSIIRCAYRGWYLPPGSSGVGPGDSDYIGFRVAKDSVGLIGKKLFPQITDGIYNAEGRLVMNCQVGSDGLTATDTAWHKYNPPAGKGKRWGFNQTPYTTEPLVNYRFDDKFSGLQVTINVEIFNLSNIWEVSESYQEILQLGGKVSMDLPDWFAVPQDRLSYDFDEGTWFPSGWALPKGKFACWEGAAKYKQKDRNGRHPLLDFGFTHVAENTISAGGSVPDKEHQCRVFGDAEWLDMSRGGDQHLWHNDGWKHRGERMEIVIPDFENADHWKWNQEQFDRFRDLVTDFKLARPDCLLGCWGVGVINHSLRIFDHIDSNGRPTGVVNLAAAEQWAGKYAKPEAELNRIFDYCGLNFGNPSVYWLNGGNPAHLYAVVQEWEVGKLARPNIPNVISTWIQTEFVDGYPLSTYRFKTPDGKEQWRGIKHQSPPSLVYAFSLFAHCRMDGAYCWETGNIYSEDAADAGEPGESGMQKPVRRTFNGVDKNVYYYIKYFGFYNYHVLGMWQASQNKDIIETKTAWFMPEILTSQGKIWRIDKQRYPSYCNLFREPLVRAKFNSDKSELLVIACNPHNRGVQQVRVREPKSDREVSFELIGDYPVIKRFRFRNK